MSPQGDFFGKINGIDWPEKNQRFSDRTNIPTTIAPSIPELISVGAETTKALQERLLAVPEGSCLKRSCSGFFKKISAKLHF